MTLSGIIVESKANGGYGDFIEGADVSVQYANEEVVLDSCKTLSKGKYTIGDLGPGLYKLTVKKEGYLTATQYQYLNGMSDRYQNMTIALIKKTDSTGGLTGKIRDSVSLREVPELSLKLRNGFNNTEYGEVVESVDTKSDGSYSFNEIEAGYYCIEIHDEKGIYIDTTLNVIVMGNSCISIQDGIVSKVEWKNQMRIVLTWNDMVRDLDSHILGTSEYFHLYYGYKDFINSKGELTVSLDVDDIYYYGPETITVYDPDISFLYYVHNYSGGSNTVLSGSEATVQVYTGNRLIDIYHVPFGNGYRWNVFFYDGRTGMLIPSNEIQ